MKQRALFPHRPQNGQTRARLADRFAAGNRDAAEIIWRDAARYGGDGSLMVIWARLVLRRAAEWELVV